MAKAVKMSLVRRTFLFAACAIFTFTACCAQDSTTPRRPHITIKLPENIPSENVWVRYDVNRRISRGERLQLENGSREYVIPGFWMPNGEPEKAKIVLYSPGCEFKTYEVPEDSIVNFRCDALPTKTVHGVIAPDQIPRTISYPIDKRVEVVGELDYDWTCSFLMQQNEGSFCGSCLGSGVPLGVLGIIDPAEGGRFELAIPDFGRDPTFKLATEWKISFGAIEMGLRDGRSQFQLGGIMPKDAPKELRALQVATGYPETMEFTRVH